MIILLVEDNPVDAKIIQDILMHHYPLCVIITTGTAEEALAACTEHHDLDLIVTDLHLPGSDGYELCKAIKAQGSPCCDVPIMMVSSDSNKVLTAAKSLAAGAFAFESKPIARKRFIEDIKAGLGWGRARRERVEIHAQLTERIAQHA